MEEYKKISYSQCGEDLIARFIFDVIGIPKPSYIDIGAYHPYLFSNTALFYLQGCRGVNIEPNKCLYELFLKERSEDLNLNIGISDKAGELVFYVMEPPTLSSFSKDISETYMKEHNHCVKDTIKVRTETLENIVTRYCNNIFPDFMSLDAEGIDDLIIKSIDYDKNSPKVICLESITYSTTGDGIKNYETIRYLEARGYMVYADTYINTIFVKKNLWNRK